MEKYGNIILYIFIILGYMDRKPESEAELLNFFDS